MSHFYANIKGNRGEATRRGTKQSGMYGHIRGWHVGAVVEIVYDEESGQDVVRIYKSSGSNGIKANELICEIWENKGIRYADARIQMMMRAINSEADNANNDDFQEIVEG